MDCNHFAPYKGEVFNKYINMHINFLEKFYFNNGTASKPHIANTGDWGLDISKNVNFKY
jgi:hypothetical protein